MLEINKFKTHLDSIEIGTEFIFKKLINSSLTANPQAPNDAVLCELVDAHGKQNGKLWVRHLLNECEIITGEQFTDVLFSGSSDEQEINLPDSFIIIGYNFRTKKVIINPKFS